MKISTTKIKRSVIAITLSVFMVASLYVTTAFASEYYDASSNITLGANIPPSGTVPAIGGQVSSVQEFSNAIGGEASSKVEGNKVTLIEDVYLFNTVAINSGDFTLDLNGYDILGMFPRYSMIELRSGSLKINDAFGRGKIENLEVNPQQNSVLTIGGKLEINGGKISGVKADGGDVCINSGKIHSASSALNISSYSTVTINDGEIIGSGIKSGALTGQGIYSEGNLTINGGKIAGRALDGILSKGQLVINGGSISSGDSGAGVEIYVMNNSASAKINGGTINGQIGLAVYNYAEDSKVSLSGGTFTGTEKSFNSNLALSKSIAKGFKAVDDKGKNIEKAEEITSVTGLMSIVES